MRQVCLILGLVAVAIAALPAPSAKAVELEKLYLFPGWASYVNIEDGVAPGVEISGGKEVGPPSTFTFDYQGGEVVLSGCGDSIGSWAADDGFRFSVTRPDGVQETRPFESRTVQRGPDSVTDMFAIGDNLVVVRAIDLVGPKWSLPQVCLVTTNNTVTDYLEYYIHWNETEIIDPKVDTPNPNGQLITYVSHTQPTRGSVGYCNEGTTFCGIQSFKLRYTPERTPAGLGRFTFTYTIQEDGVTRVIRVAVTVQNAPLEGVPLHRTIPWTGEVIIDPKVDNVINPDGDTDTLTFLSNTQPERGSAGYCNAGTTFCGNKSFKLSYTPERTLAGLGTFSFSYVVYDGFEVLTIPVTVTVTNAPPVGVDHHFTIPWNDEIIFDPVAPKFVSNSDGNSLTFLLNTLTQPERGSVGYCNAGTTFCGNRSFKIRYVPERTPAGLGTFDFSYIVTDGIETETITITVTVTNTPPTGDDLEFRIYWTQQVVFDPIAHIPNPDGNGLSVVSFTQPSIGQLRYCTASPGTCGSSYKKLVYTPLRSPPTTGTFSFEYMVTDGIETDVVTVTIIVKNPGEPLEDNRPPIIDSVTSSVPAVEGATVTVSVDASDPDGGAEVLRYAFDCDDDGSYELGPQLDPAALCHFEDNGSFVVNVTVSDEDGAEAQSSTTVHVANAPPTAELGNDGPVRQDEPATASFTGPSDPSGIDTDAGLHYAFSCAGEDLAGATYADTGTEATITCTFPDAGIYEVTGRIIDKDGGGAAPDAFFTTSIVVADVTGPSTTGQATGTVGNNGWHRGPVTVSLVAIDNAGGSGVKEITYRATGAHPIDPTTAVGSTLDLVISAEGETTLSFFAADNAGNQEVEQSLLLKIDQTAPTITGNADPAPNGSGWNSSAVVITFACDDPTSGLASCSPAVNLSDHGAGQSATGTAEDAAGNTASTTVGDVNIDLGAPTLSATAATVSGPYTPGTWTNQAVTVSFTCADDLSGTASLTSPVTVATEGANQTVVSTCVDNAGHSTSLSVEGINIDLSPPSCTASVNPSALWPPNNKMVTVNAIVTPSDATSGPVGFTLISVTSDEGNAANDIQGFGLGTADTSGQLRAKRDGNGDGRVYTLTYQTTDVAGNVSSCGASVTVPHN